MWHIGRGRKISATEQAADQALKGHIRTHLANERTFAAWVRTGISISMVGLVIARFLATQHSGLTRFFILLGDAYVLTGISILGFSAYNFFQAQRQIEAGQFRVPKQVLLGIVIVLSVLTSILMILLTFEMWSHKP